MATASRRLQERAHHHASSEDAYRPEIELLAGQDCRGFSFRARESWNIRACTMKRRAYVLEKTCILAPVLNEPAHLPAGDKAKAIPRRAWINPLLDR